MRFVTILIICLISAPATAGVLGKNWGDNWRVGWLGTLTQNKVDDNDGPTDKETDTSVLNVLVLPPAKGLQRFLIQGYQQEFRLAPSTDHIGQDVERTGINASTQWRWNLAGDWRPWIGFGVGYVSESHSNRHTIRADGFLDQSFAEESPAGFVAVLSATTEWSLAEQWSLGLHIQHEQPFGDTTQVTSVGLAVLYDF
ncbi:MAG: hypothetical protein HY308_09295 [Gammaproteobacteria bacterium]|nr:hypothetical protein [Gammaproteobacteria bacterium]